MVAEEGNGPPLSSGVSGEEDEWEILNGNLILVKQRLRFFPWVLGIISDKL